MGKFIAVVPTEEQAQAFRAEHPDWQANEVHTEPGYEPFRTLATDGVAALYKITAEEKARAVPFLNLFEVDFRTNKKIGEPLSFQFRQPADFGKSLGNVRYGERPAVSFESVSIKTVNPTGLILFREIQMSITVHRPDVLFDSGGPAARTMGALITSGRTFVMTYGWQGGSGAILQTGHNKAETVEIKDPNDPEKTKKKTDWTLQFPARRSIRFSVVNYTFKVNRDNSISFSVFGMEDGELFTRNAIFLDQDGMENQTLEKRREALRVRVGQMAILKQVDVSEGTGSNDMEPRFFVTLKDLFDIFVARPLERSYNQLGITDVDLNLGVFNGKCMQAAERYGGLKHAAGPIGGFLIPVDRVDEIINMILTHEQVTVYNVMLHVMDIIHDPKTWSRKDTPPDALVSQPQMVIRTQYDVNKKKASVWVIDLKRYVTQLNGGSLSEHDLHLKKAEFTKQLDRFLAQGKLAKIVLGRGESFIEDASFDVTNDELMKSIQAKKSLLMSRDAIAAGDPRKVEELANIASAQFLYRSAVRGRITMLGNFVFDALGEFWIDFGVRFWDGIFWIREKTDTVTSSGFTSTVDVIAEGSNPLGVKAAPPTTAPDLANDPSYREKFVVQYNFQRDEVNRSEEKNPFVTG